LVLIALAMGYLARKLERFPENASDVLNRFVVDVCLPATILRLLPKLSMRWDLLLLVVAPWLLVAVSWLCSRVLTRDRKLQAALFLCCALANTSFLGFPLIGALLGEPAISLAAVYDQLGTFLALSSIAPIVVARATGGAELGAWTTAKRVLAFPPFLALVLGLLPLPAQPAWLESVLSMLSRALIPVAMFAVGLRLRISPPSERRLFFAALSLKLVLFPALALLLGTLSGASRAVRDVVVLEAAMPASITAGAIAMGAGLAPELAAALVGWGLLLAQLTVPAWALLLR
jgi:predicted permease